MAPQVASTFEWGFLTMQLTGRGLRRGGCRSAAGYPNVKRQTDTNALSLRHEGYRSGSDYLIVGGET